MEFSSESILADMLSTAVSLGRRLLSWSGMNRRRRLRLYARSRVNDQTEILVTETPTSRTGGQHTIERAFSCLCTHSSCSLISSNFVSSWPSSESTCAMSSMGPETPIAHQHHHGPLTHETTQLARADDVFGGTGPRPWQSGCSGFDRGSVDRLTVRPLVDGRKAFHVG